MYSIVEQIINHVYQGSSGYGDQQYIYYICGALIPLFFVVVVDGIKGIFRGFFRG